MNQFAAFPTGTVNPGERSSQSGSTLPRSCRSVLFPALAMVLAATFAVAPRAFCSPEAAEILPADVPADWWGAVQRDIVESEYHIAGENGPVPAGPGAAYQAPNRAQDFRTYFDADGIRLTPRTVHRDEAPAWEWRLTLKGWGREGGLAEPGDAPQMVVNGNRVEYRRGDITEWYVNDARGLEQGFTIHHEPETSGTRDPLRVELAVGGTLKATLEDHGDAVNFLTPAGARAIRFDHLSVIDARQRVLPARFERHDTEGGERVAIVVDDSGALYPITIDPLATGPSWAAQPDQANAQMGASVATAGDVNGDGFSDVIVGAHLFDNGQADEGRAFVYHGSAAGLIHAVAWTAESNQASPGFGSSVSTAGDVNGDGFSDVIVGARYFDNGQSDEGRAYVYYGSAGGLSPTANWTAESDQLNANFGWSVSTAGDVNGDGFSDVIVGARHFDNGQTDEGRVYVYHGSAGGLNSTASWTTENNVADARLGSSVSSAGDVNGDGYGDVVVGAPAYTNALFQQGQAIVYHGSAGGLGGFNWVVSGALAGILYGTSVATAGDVNGDGYGDVIVGAQFFFNDQSGEGRAYVYHGSATGLSAGSNWTNDGDQANALFGYSVATAGDVNGDGYSDVIVGAYIRDNGQSNEGQAFVFQGSPGGLSLTANWTGEPDQASAWFGYSVATAGDVNGDGFSDVIVGAVFMDDAEGDEGRAIVYHGAPAGLGTNANWLAESNQAVAYLGYSVAGAGDVNGDGFSDVIVGAPLFDNGQADEGRAFVYHGSAAGLSFTAGWTGESNQVNAQYGVSVATAGDVNGDGFSDVVVSALLYDNGQTDEGRVFLYLGSPSGLAVASAWTAESNQASSQFGFSASTAGDVNGDGFSDVVVGAYTYGANAEGRIFVYHGSATGLPGVPNYTSDGTLVGGNRGYCVGPAGDVNNDGYSDVIVGAPGHVDGGRAYIYISSSLGLGVFNPPLTLSGSSDPGFGTSVGTAGDVNGDGFSDVIVGDPYVDNGPSTSHDDGKLYVYHGSAPFPNINSDWTLVGTSFSAQLGRSVGTAGDVNGDGYSDVIVGAPYYENGETDEGAAFAYYGSATGLGALAWSTEGGQTSANFGGSVASAGDVNGDGYSDVIVGAGGFDNGQSNEGRAYVYYGNGGTGLPFVPRQVRSDDSAPISLLGTSDSETAFRLEATGFTAAGQAELRLQYEVKPAGVPFDGTGLVTSSAVSHPAPDGASPISAQANSTPLSVLVSGLTPGTLYHWRLRVISDSPFFPHSRWLSLPGNAPSEADVRTAGMVSAVDDETESPFVPTRLAPGSPNPFRSATEISFTLPERGHHRLAVYDVSGREVAVLASGLGEAGNHRLTWDGRDERGALPSGVYFLRLEHAGRVESRKLMIIR